MSDRHVGLGIESVYGTPVVPTAFFEVLREDIQLTREFIRIKTVRSKSTRQVHELVEVVRGTMEVALNYQDFPVLAYGLLGDVDTTGAGPYVHTLPGSTGLADRPSWTVEVKRDASGTNWRYAGCIITGITLNVALNQEARATVSFIGASEANVASAVASYGDLDVILPKHATVNVDGSPADATGFDLVLAYPVDEPNVLGSVALARAPEDEDVLEVTGSFTALFEDLTIYDLADGETEVDVQLSCDSGGDELLVINMDVAKLPQATPHIEGRARQIQTVTFEAYNTGAIATDPLQIIGTNDDTVVP